MQDFKNIRVWNHAVDFVIMIYETTDLFPDTEKYGLSSQLRRAAVSVPANIAEGRSRTSDKDFNRFIEIALGSAFEIETCLIIAFRLNLIQAIKFNELSEKIYNIKKMLFGYSVTLKK